MKPALDQFAEGLDTVEFLTKMQQFPAELKKLLCHDKQHLNAENIKSLFIPTLSEIGSNRRTVETRILAFWWDYLLDCEGRCPFILISAKWNKLYLFQI